MQAPTIKIKSADYASGFVIINAEDFDPAVHVAYDAPKAEAKPSNSVDDAKARASMAFKN